MEPGFVKFKSRSFSFRGDKGTWAKINQDGSLTICKAAKGLISDEYFEEISKFARKHGIDFKSMPCGQKITK